MPAFGQTASLDEAARLEKEQDTSAALRMYGGLLSSLPVSPDYFRAFDGYFRLESDLARLLRAEEDLLVKADDAALPPGLASRFASLFELSGRLEKAQSLYEREYASSGSLEAFNAAVRLGIEMNDVDGVAKLISSGPAQAGNDLLAGQAALARGDFAASRASLLSALDDTKGGAVSAQALYWLYAEAAAQGDAKEADAVASKLKETFPRSPETAVLETAPSATGRARSRIVIAPVPPRLSAVESQEGAPTSAGDAAGASKDSQPKASVQTGSYTVKENAEDMVAELKKRGFASAVVRELTISGKTYFKALAAVSLDLEEAKKTADALRGMGFESFLLFEDR